MVFFATNNPQGHGFESFGPLHCGWIAATVIAAVILSLLHRRMQAPARRRLQRALCLSMMGVYLIRQLIIILKGEYGIGFLPLHLCGMSIYIETIDSLLPNKFTRGLCYAVCLPGSTMGLLFANWTDMPFFNFIHITSFLLHGMMIVYPVMVVASGEYRPSLRDLPACFGFLLAVSVPVYFFNRHFGTNYMFLAQPSAGSPLVWFEQWLGNPGYLLGFVIMIAVVWALMFLPFALTEKNVKKDISE